MDELAGSTDRSSKAIWEYSFGSRRSRARFESLILEHADMLMATLRASVRDHHVVEDLFQETIIAAWSSWESYDLDRPFGAWLRGISRNVVLLHWRKSARKKEMISLDRLDHIDALIGAYELENRQASTQLVVFMEQCIDSLSKKFRDIICKRYLEGDSLDDCITYFQLSREALLKRIQRARTFLKQCVRKKLEAADQ